MSPHLDRVPPLDEVPQVASEVRRAWGLRPTSRLNLSRVCDRLDIEVSVISMGAPDGGAQGFLIPRTDGRRFSIEVDPEPADGWEGVPPGLRRSLERHRTRFLVAHELAHTLFYEEGARGPQRLVGGSVKQEKFCDELARALLVPRQAAAVLPLSPEGAVELQRRFDVSMEVALRSVAVTHEDVGAAWLLLRRGGKTLVQWTSAERSFTSHALRALRKLATMASRDRHAEGVLTGGDVHARALYLPDREQVVVTCERSLTPV